MSNGTLKGPMIINGYKVVTDIHSIIAGNSSTFTTRLINCSVDITLFDSSNSVVLSVKQQIKNVESKLLGQKVAEKIREILNIINNISSIKVDILK